MKKYTSPRQIVKKSNKIIEGGVNFEINIPSNSLMLLDPNKFAISTGSETEDLSLELFPEKIFKSSTSMINKTEIKQQYLQM